MTRSALKIFTLVAALIILVGSTTYAQYTPIKRKPITSKKNDKYFDDKGSFVQHLQYGIHINPSLLSISSNNFGIGVAPSIGYKFNKTLMAGVTTGIDYSYQRYQINGLYYTYTPVNFNYGVYGRVRVFNLPVYIYDDYKNATYQQPNLDGSGNIILSPTNPNKFDTQSQTRPEMNLGLSYRGGNGIGWGTEFIITYNVLTKTDDFRPSPFDIKIGFTYNY